LRARRWEPGASVTFAEAHAVLGQVRTLAVLVDLHDGPGLALELRP